MSSFVISKVEYVKAAGFVAGLMSAYDHGSEALWMWDPELGRAMTEKDVYDRFVECFRMNAQSVYDQYSPRHPDETLCVDNEAYRAEFTEYRKKGQNVAYDETRLLECVQNLRDFFQSALYQTEDEESNDKMDRFFNRILVTLLPKLYPHEVSCWGEFTA